jgi:hypothetical protein
LDQVFEAGLSVISTVATGVIGYLVYRIKKNEDAKDAELQNQRKEAAMHAERQKKEAEALRVSLLALTRDRILQGYRYYRREGGISPQDLETMTKLYMAYHALGGNGTITAVYDKIKALPIKEG